MRKLYVRVVKNDGMASTAFESEINSIEDFEIEKALVEIANKSNSTIFEMHNLQLIIHNLIKDRCHILHNNNYQRITLATDTKI